MKDGMTVARSEANGGLPEGWVSVPISEIASNRSGNSKLIKGKQSSSPSSTAPYPGFSASGQDVWLKTYDHEGKAIIVSAVGARCGKAFEADGKWSAIANTHIVRPNLERIDHKLFWYLINDEKFWVKGGSAQPFVKVNKTFERRFNLPPLPEQKRIADKLELVLSRVEACRTRLELVPALLKRFRQSVLAAATSGRLTEEWRVENVNVEPASRLLARIKESRLALAKTSKQKRQIEECLDEHNLSAGEEEIGLEDIPDSWLACRIGAIGTVCNGSTPSRSRTDFWDGGIPWISSGEVRNNIIATTRERITKTGFEGSSVKLLPGGTVLLAMIGEGKTRGQSALLHIAATINQNIAAVVLDHGLVLSEYVWRWFQFQYEATRMRGNGSGPQALNCQRVRELPFILPPLPEQTEIVRRVEALFALADRIEARLATAQTTVARLTPAALAKAFRGELVPQDPDDEPAAVLLERLREQQTTARPKPARVKRVKRP